MCVSHLLAVLLRYPGLQQLDLILQPLLLVLRLRLPL